jgi:uncharacterized protein YbbK (DUF523 family)
MILASACLCGINCKYNGGNNRHPVFKELMDKGKLVLVCPEELGGLSIPRSPGEILGGTGKDVLNGNARVINKEGQDISREFIKGARLSLELALKQGIKTAVLRRRSPSCGCGSIYDGSFTSTLREGDGVTTALLKQHGISVISDDEFLQHGAFCDRE